MHQRLPVAARAAAAWAALLATGALHAQPAAAPGPSAVVRQVVQELFNGGDLAAAERRFVDGMAQDERAFTIAVRRAFPDLQLTLDQVVEQGPWVAVRWTARGTHGDTFAGIPATGRHVSWGGAWFWRVDGARIVEGQAHNVWDRAGLLEQLTRPSRAVP